MFGRKNKEKIKELEREIQLIDNRYDGLYKELRDENAQLRRILENISTGATYVLKKKIEHVPYNSYKSAEGFVCLNNDYTTRYHTIVRKYLYIYIDRKEYRIDLAELNSLDIVEGSEAFWIEDGLAHFDILTGEKQRTRHKFLIEYESGKYLYSQEPFGDNGGKEDGEDV